MKKIILFAFCALLFVSCKKENNNSKEDISEIIQKGEMFSDEVSTDEEDNIGYKDIKFYALDAVLSEDFNGDGVADKAEMILNSDGMKTIIITDGKTGVKTDLVTLGGEMPDNFGWADRWAITKDVSTFEIVVEDGEVAGDTISELEHPSIVLTKEEQGGGVITYSNKVYRWIHQSC